MAYLVRLDKPVLLADPVSGQRILNDRPYLLHNMAFVQLCVSRRQLRVIDAEVSDRATDHDFEMIWGEFRDCETQERSAIASFLSMYGSNNPEALSAPEVIPPRAEKPLPEPESKPVEVTEGFTFQEDIYEAPSLPQHIPSTGVPTVQEVPEGHRICERCGTVYLPRARTQKYCNGPECKK